MKKIALLLTLPFLLSSAFAETEITSFQTPLQAVLADNNFIENTELPNVTLSQDLNRGESANKVMITLTESGLMDDSIAAIKTIYFIKQNDDATWIIDEKFESRKCRRGEDAGVFTTDRCL